MQREFFVSFCDMFDPRMSIRAEGKNKRFAVGCRHSADTAKHDHFLAYKLCLADVTTAFSVVHQCDRFELMTRLNFG